MGWLLFASLITLGLLPVISPAHARANDVCTQYAKATEKRLSIPEGILVAISHIEAGRLDAKGQVQAWPWTSNIDGRGKYYESLDQAVDGVYAALQKGAGQVDVGCMQINLRWHGDNFSSLRDMFQPDINVYYAGSFLKTLYEQTGDWDKAVRYYHSRTAKYHEAYFANFQRAFQALKSSDASYQTAQYAPSNKSSSFRPKARPSEQTLSSTHLAQGNHVKNNHVKSMADPILALDPKAAQAVFFLLERVARGDFPIDLSDDDVIERPQELPVTLRVRWDEIKRYRAEFEKRG